MKDSFLELKNINAHYGANAVLRDFSLSIESGELIALLGASGSGKTTALKAIAGLLPDLNGEIWLGGENITNVPAEKRETALVFQKPLLFPFLNVAENIGFGLKMRRRSAAEITGKVTEALRLVQLEGFERRTPKQLSGGQEQRVALARALVTNPRILLLDEPFSALDAKLRAEMRVLVRNLQKKFNITTVFVTHDQDEAVSIADRIAFVYQGRVAQFAPPSEFFTAPETPEIARFFGWKVLNGVVKENRIETENGIFCLPADAAAFQQNQSVQIAFHPSSLRFGSYATDSNCNLLFATLESKNPLGSRLRYAIRLKNEDLIEAETSVPETIDYLQSNHLQTNLSASIPIAQIVLYGNK